MPAGKTVRLPCGWCGGLVELRGRTGLAQARRGRGYCSEPHKAAWVTRDRSERMARTNRQYASPRMRTRNPMARADARERMRATLRGRGHRPPVQGGNGPGLTRPQALLLAALPATWAAEVVVPVGLGRGQGFPTAYKLDLADAGARIAVEVDGHSHKTMQAQGRDAMKTAVLEVLGWRVLRFQNQEVLDNLAACARRVLVAAEETPGDGALEA
jgi:hypothetical protein